MGTQPLLSLRLAAATFGATMAVGALAPAVMAAPAPSTSPQMHLVVAKKPVAPRAQTTTIIRTTANLNLRQNPGAHFDSLAVLKKGTVVTRTGKSSGAWWEMRAGSRTGWVSSHYLAKSTVAAPAPQAATGYRTNANLNLRQHPGTHFKSLVVLARGTAVARTGKASGAWWEVKAGSRTGWVSSHYLVKASGQVPDSNPVTGANRWVDGTQPMYAKASLSSSRLSVQTDGTKVRLVKTAGNWSYIDTPAGQGWIPGSSLATSEPNNNSTSYRWTAYAANVRTGPSTSFSSLGILPANEKMAYLKTSDGWSQVKTTKGTGWIKNTLLTSVEYRAPQALQPMTRAMIQDVQERFGAGISGVGGSRAGSIGHSSGLAADFMIKDHSSAAGIKAGDRIAEYLVENHERLGISYLIWRDKLWLAEDGQWGPYSTGGWGKHLESSRGWNATTLHMDHIHAEISSARANK
ncbi:SH3 domain-containing protein [Paeniglutamicibacter psychrophenolicus]|uniref:SH3 domain-containing protein n=1 Tax=Paeniglutamicibacter psychrophenolicus TaxID=257454 RepID=UPI0027844DB1|nr:SH3 domain-containing protein [Paeniglutamicibacter psychrophenolicus]MDQ0096240.1 uncharacterized protein YgiM (DUF1202 family) [Paeniglutamicibacter psychrophenolicus]